MRSPRLGVLGHKGRMGQAIMSLAPDFPYFSFFTPRAGVPLEEKKEIFQQCDIVVDFTHASLTRGHLEQAAKLKRPLLLGTTGLTTDHQQAAQETAKYCPLLIAPNTSLGHAVLMDVVKKSAQILGSAFDIEIIDIHHRRKDDAPSGTALSLAKAAAQGRNLPERAIAPHDASRQGQRPADTINLSVIRAGEQASEHQVLFVGPKETLHLVHRITDRAVLARGALNAARWLYQQPPGLYTLEASLPWTP